MSNDTQPCRRPHKPDAAKAEIVDERPLRNGRTALVWRAPCRKCGQPTRYETTKGDPSGGSADFFAV